MEKFPINFKTRFMLGSKFFHFSLFTFTFFYYLCSVKLKEDEKQTILE